MPAFQAGRGGSNPLFRSKARIGLTAKSIQAPSHDGGVSKYEAEPWPTGFVKSKSHYNESPINYDGVEKHEKTR